MSSTNRIRQRHPPANGLLDALDEPKPVLYRIFHLVLRLKYDGARPSAATQNQMGTHRPYIELWSFLTQNIRPCSKAGPISISAFHAKRKPQHQQKQF
jgi:hypothetical protein